MTSKKNYYRRKHADEAKRENNIRKRWKAIDPNNLFSGLLVLATFALAYIAWQTDRTLHQTLVSSNRAWVGPHQASLDKEPTSGATVLVRVQYQNTGREPAQNFFSDLKIFAASQKDEEKGIIERTLNEGLAACKVWSVSEIGGVVYPITTGLGGGYILTEEADPKIIDDVVKTGKYLIVHGCFVYRTYGVARHSYFCYFYRKEQTKTIASLGICHRGHYAD